MSERDVLSDDMVEDLYRAAQVDLGHFARELSEALGGVSLIAAERQRQVQVEGWTTKHDDSHVNGELAQAAACYAWPPPRSLDVKLAWPWGREWWKPEFGSATEGPDRIRTLVKAGALILAEIERLRRASPESERSPKGWSPQ